MISEKRFALSHVSFWRQLLPMSEEYVRTRNRSLGRFTPPLASFLPADTRGIVNELGFRLFVASSSTGRFVGSLSEQVIDSCAQVALQHIRRMREYGRKPIQYPDSRQVEEGIALAERLVDFFGRFTAFPLQPLPLLPGCGWIDDCEGDVLSGRTLFEVKAGQRSLRAIDLRQVLIYSALDFAAKMFGIVHICLVNPRTGLFFFEPVEQLCQNLAGRSATDVLGEIVEYISEPQDRSQAS